MFPYRMARKYGLYTLLLLTTLIHVITAAPSSGLGDIASYIPSCAAGCFDSFVDVSFDDHPAISLASLCPRLGAYGFTIGEAAVQCIVAEKSTRACSEKDASDEVINKAYWMCYGRPKAQQPTHKVITVTLAIPPSGSGPITFPPTSTGDSISAPTASSTSRRSLSLPTTLVTDPTPLSSSGRSTATTSTKHSSASSSTETLLVPTSTAEAASPATTTSTSTDVPSSSHDGSQGKQETKPLSTGQVAGVAVGCVAGAGFIGIAIAICCRYCRRRKSSDHKRWRRKHGRLSSRDSWENIEKGRNGGRATDSWIANQLIAPLDPGPMPRPGQRYNRGSWRPSAIGLALSPSHPKEGNKAATPIKTPTRPLSKLLPAKPSMDNGPPRLELSFTHQSTLGIPSAAPAATSNERPAGRGTVAAATAAATTAVAVGAYTAYKPPQNGAASAATSADDRGVGALTPRKRSPQPAPLKIQIPKVEKRKTFIPLTGGMESSVTEFEEDGGTLSPGGLIWRPPSIGPMTATTYYVADKNGNWVLGDPTKASQMVSPMTAEPRLAMPKLAVAAGVGAGAVALAAGGAYAVAQSRVKGGTNSPKANTAISKSAEAQKPTTIMAIPAEKTIRMVDQSSSTYSSDEEAKQPYAPRQVVADNSNNSAPRQSFNGRLSFSRALTRPRINSPDSGVTTITTSSDDMELRSPPPVEQQMNLSPVAESPHSGSGRSPVSYPKIPGRGTSLRATSKSKAISPTAAKDYAAAAVPEKEKHLAPPVRLFANNSAAQSSPTLGVPLGTGTMSSNASPSLQAKKLLGPRLVASPTTIRTGSPMIRGQTTMPGLDDRQKLPSANTQNNLSLNGKSQGQPREQAQQAQPAQAQRAQQEHPGTQPQQTSQVLAPFQQRAQEQQRPQQQPKQPLQQPGHIHQRRPSYNNNNPMPYQLPPHPTAYRAYLDPSPLPYQTRLPDFNPAARTLNHPDQTHQNRYPRPNQSPFYPQTRGPFRPPGQQEQPFRQQQQPPQDLRQPTLPNVQMPISRRPQPHPYPYPNNPYPTNTTGGQPQNPGPRSGAAAQPERPGPRPLILAQQYPQQQPQQRESHAPSSSPTSENPLGINSPASSSVQSLLEKRLGASRAATMAIPTQGSSSMSTSSASSAQSKWRREQQQQQQQQPPFTPRMGAEGEYPQIGELPATPIWMPKLTPSRRGDDLYLNVQ